MAPNASKDRRRLRRGRSRPTRYHGTDLDLQLRRRGITNIVLCGISTSIGVESTARDAWERGYNLTFVRDAMTDRSLEAHERSFEIIFPRIGEIGTVAEIAPFI